MAEASPQVHEPEPKRRKVRKGTRNCWECRRRKVRCIFAASTEAICENCRRRGTACNRQEYADEPVSSLGSNQVEARLARIEELIERGLSTTQPTRPKPPSERPSPAAATPLESTRNASNYEDLSRALTVAWPSQRDIDAICSLPVGLSAHLHSGINTPYSTSLHWDPPSPREMLQLPAIGSHPVLIARKLLVLGTFLQAVVPSSLQNLADHGASYHELMSCVVDTAIRLVNTDDALIGSVEGIECIMLEAMYQNYAGKLHRAWMAVRRATSVAEMMGLHRGRSSQSLKILEAEMRAVFNPDQICFRLVEMDRYLSLMLGLPSNSLEARFATPKALEGCLPIDRLQRIHCAMTDRILQRNETNLSDTYEIDTILQEAAAEMPPQWWLMPNLSASSKDGTEVLHETIRLMDQFTHYHLLTRLHLPYMLRSSSERQREHSRSVVVNVSRETLTRFIAFRNSNPAHFYCRGTDFLAFIATTALCLAHIDSRGGCQGPADHESPAAVFDSLAHSRPSDRGMMERTLEIMGSMAHDGTDAIAFKIARILRPLLAMEADAASGTSYCTNTSKNDEEELECHGKSTNGGKRLYVHIPHFGTIHFERGAVSKSVSTVPTVSEQGLSTTLGPNLLDEHNQQPPFSPHYPPAGQIGSQMGHQNAQIVRLKSSQLTSPQQPPPPGYGVSSSTSGNLQQDEPAFSVGNAIVEDGWDLQGIDVALFDSLFHGATISGTTEEVSWAHWASN